MVLELNIHMGKIKAHPTTMHTINSRKITKLNIVSKSKQKKKVLQPRGKQIFPKIQELLLRKKQNKKLGERSLQIKILLLSRNNIKEIEN